MNLIEKTRKRFEENEILKEQFYEKSKLLKELKEEHSVKVKERILELNKDSHISENEKEIERLKNSLSLAQNTVKNLANGYSQELSKKMGIEELKKEADDIYYKIYTPNPAISFKLKELLEEMCKITGKKYKAKLRLDFQTNVIVKLMLLIKSCAINVQAETNDFFKQVKGSWSTTDKLNHKNLADLTIEITDATLLNFFEQDTKDKTQNVIKEV